MTAKPMLLTDGQTVTLPIPLAIQERGEAIHLASRSARSRGHAA